MQLFRVNVLLQPPDGQDVHLAKPPFFVLRRYNQFRALYEQVGAAARLPGCKSVCVYVDFFLITSRPWPWPHLPPAMQQA